MFEFTKYYSIFHTVISNYCDGFTTTTTNMALDHDSSSEVEIRDAYRRYSTNNVVLQGLNMTVKRGTIYGLLGPSGCGKTTVLSCITGISTLDSGTIFVRCQDRRQIGYMPQEVAMMEKFKISELLHYFGKVYGMDHDTVEKRAKDLLLLVNLPPNQFYHLYITSLSGGQQRKVSLLVALIHDPDLLILDEPTVGLDPVTRCTLWEYFLKETEQQGKTILITTHYFEEAKQSDTLGFMRGGVLLAEGSADKLLNDFNSSTLEHVFLQLSQNQSISPSEIKPFPKTKSSPLPTFADKNSYCNFSRLTAQTKKNFYWMKRNQWLVAYIILLPAMMSLLFCMSHSNNLKGLWLATVSEEPCTNNTTSLTPRCDAQYKASCHFTQLMRDKGYVVSEYPDIRSGMNDVRQGRSLALLHFQPNYTSALIDYLSSSISNPPDDKALDNCQLQVTTDMTEKLKAGQITIAVTETFTEIQTELLKSCGYKSSSYNSIVRDPVKVYGAGSIDMIHNALPGFIIPLVFYMAISYSSTAAGSERATGVFRRSLVSGVTKLEMNLALMAVQLIVLSVQNCLILVTMYVSLDVPMQGSGLLAFTFVGMAELQGIFYGIFLASIIEKETLLTNTAVGTVMALFLTSGMIWPVEGMVPWLKHLVDYSPMTIAVEAFRSVSVRGWGLDNPKVLSAFHYNIATLAILVAANVISAKNNRTL